MAIQNLFVYQGCDFSIDMQMLNDNGTSINIAHYTFTGVVRKNFYSQLPSANLVINVFDAANGNTLIQLSAANTANLEGGTYQYTILANTGSNTVQLMSGDFTVIPGVLNAQPTYQTTVFPQVLPNTTFYDTANSNQFA